MSDPALDEIPKGMPKLGEIFAGKYRIEKVLGAGGMGVVYAARHLHLDELVALKLIRPECAEPEFLARFLREGRAMVRIRSVHVPRIYDVGADEKDISFLAMEHLEGSDLGSSAGALPISLVVDYVVQACDALAHAHVNGIVHRDIKPSNLFTANTVDGTIVKVLDFGIAKTPAVEPSGKNNFVLTQTGGTMGSPLYMPPEQVRASRDVDHRADIWALGVVLFELITGSAPFEGSSLPAIAASIVVDPPRSMIELKPSVPPGLALIVNRCLEKDPEKRWSSVGELAVALAPYGTVETAARIERIDRVEAGSARRIALPRPAGPDLAAPAVKASVPDPVRAEKIRSFSRRPTLVATVAVLLTLGVVGLVLVVVALGRSGASTTPVGLMPSTTPLPIATESTAKVALPPPDPSVSAAPTASSPVAEATSAPTAKKPVPGVRKPDATTSKPTTTSPPPDAPKTVPTTSSGLVRDRHGN